MMKLSKLDKIDLRQVWKNETSDFNFWLSKPENFQLLNSELGLNLRFVKREAPAGRYRLDLLAIDNVTGDYAIIENQLTETDHSHLGKTITYASHYNTKHIIWIVKEIRPEYEKAFKWLSEKLTSDINLFLVKIELFSIENSIPAPKLTLLVKPLDWIIKNSSDNIFEALPEEINKIEKLQKIIKYSSLERFLSKNISLDERIAKLELQNLYIEQNPKDGIYFARRYSRHFDEAVRAWAKMNKFIINKDSKDGRLKSNSKEYYIFTEENASP